jgi:predicted transcriptional regulator
MRTTIAIDDNLARKAKERAAKDGHTLSWLVEKALRQLFNTGSKPSSNYRAEIKSRAAEPVAGIDWSDRDALYDRMEERH